MDRKVQGLKKIGEAVHCERDRKRLVWIGEEQEMIGEDEIQRFKRKEGILD